MAGREFNNLQTCILVNPHKYHALISEATLLPVCHLLHHAPHSFAGIRGFVVPHIVDLELGKNGHQVRGTPEMMLAKGLCVRCELLQSLSLYIKCPARDLLSTLRVLPTLKTLRIHLARPQSLGWRFFSRFIMAPCRKVSGAKHCKHWWCMLVRCTSEEQAVVCPTLRNFEVWYRRWLRSTETDGVVPIFWAIAQSRRAANRPFEKFMVMAYEDDADWCTEVGGYKYLSSSSDWPNLPRRAIWKALQSAVGDHPIQLTK